MKLLLVLFCNISLGQAFAQSAVRADEKIKNPEFYRLGDSADLQADQQMVDHLKAKKQKGQDINQPWKSKRLLKHHDMI